MAKEIEKKYLIKEEEKDYSTIDYGLRESGTRIRQGYMPLEKGKTLAEKLGMDSGMEIAEARLREKGDRYFFTLKGDGTISREEQEKEIAKEIFQEYWDLTKGKRVEKIRAKMPYEGLTAEIDFYTDRDLITAEVECPDMETAQRIKPLGKDITEDKKYKNKNLAK